MFGTLCPYKGFTSSWLTTKRDQFWKEAAAWRKDVTCSEQVGRLPLWNERGRGRERGGEREREGGGEGRRKRKGEGERGAEGGPQSL